VYIVCVVCCSCCGEDVVCCYVVRTCLSDSRLFACVLFVLCVVCTSCLAWVACVVCVVCDTVQLA